MNGLEGNLYGFGSDNALDQNARMINEAILALAFEQRTANLIAFLHITALAHEPNAYLRDEITNRLGLEA